MIKKCIGRDGTESQYIYNDGKYKGRLVYNIKQGWYSAERKAVDSDGEWERGLFGTAEYLLLSDHEKEWAVKK